jgi:hypothetical protein
MHAKPKMQIDEFSDGWDRRMAASERILQGSAPGQYEYTSIPSKRMAKSLQCHF